jgi:hypothetical protein
MKYDERSGLPLLLWGYHQLIHNNRRQPRWLKGKISIELEAAKIKGKMDVNRRRVK